MKMGRSASPRAPSPECSASENAEPATKRSMDASDRKNKSEVNAARRQAMRDLLYRKDS